MTEQEFCALLGDIDLATITKLDLSNRDLSSLPDSLPEILPNLSILFLSNNAFTELPAVIGRCPNLQMVAFKNNGMKEIHPDALQEQLRWLILTNNLITEIPNEIGRCQRLQKLMLSGNQIERLPDEMSQCNSLELVRLASNRLVEPPICLLKLPKLAWVGLSDNPFLPTTRVLEDMPRFTALDDIDYADSPVLGQGAGGITRKVTYGDEESVVAVKTPSNQMTSDGLPHMERQINTIIAKLSNVSFVPILGQTKSGDLVMEYLEDHSALADPPSMQSCSRDVYRPDALESVDDTVQMMTQLLDALVELHGHGVCHGDFYAHNILVRRGHPSRLTDFGAAFCYDRDAPYGKLVQAIELRSFGILAQEVAASSQFLEELAEQCVAPNATMEQVQIWWKQQLLKEMATAYSDSLEADTNVVQTYGQ